MREPNGNNHISRYVYILCMAVMCYASFFFFPRWKNERTEATISWDVSGYYWYLPSVFIYHDLKHQGFKDGILEKYAPTNADFQQGVELENGDYVMKYACGMAVMYFPFFITAHWLAGPLGYPQDGFSMPYQMGIQLGGLLISLIGLWHLRKLLLLFYKDKVVAIAMVLLVMGTNYLNFSSIDCGMSHTWLFTLYVFLLLNTHYFHQCYKLKYAIRIGLIVGLATLTRPTDLLSCLIPLLWGLDSLMPGAIKKQIEVLLRNYKALLVAAVCGAVVISLQVIYWKYATGHWIFYSYQDQHLYFRSPNFFNYTLSYRCGWLTYAPMMAFAFIGLLPFLKNGKNKVAITSFFLLNYYIVCSWSIWWYGGRAMVQSYPVLIFPIAALIEAALDRKALLWLLAPFALLFLYYNIWVTNYYHKSALYDNDFTSAAFFWRIAGRWNPPAYVALLKDNPDMYEGEPGDMQLIYQNNFNSDSGSVFVAQKDGKGKSLILNKEAQVSPLFTFAAPKQGAGWIRAQASFYAEKKEWESWQMAQFVVTLKNKGEKVKENMIRVHRLLGDGETKTISVDVRLPTAAFDSVSVLFWNGGSRNPITIDDLEVRTFR